VRGIVEELELYDEDELECGLAEESWGGERCESQLQVRRLKCQKLKRKTIDFPMKVLVLRL